MIAVSNPALALKLALVACSLLGLGACAPEVGSERWCESLRDQPRGDWTANEALEYARSCVFEQRGDE